MSSNSQPLIHTAETALPPQTWKPDLVYRWYRLLLSGLLVATYFYQPLEAKTHWWLEPYLLATLIFCLICISSLAMHHLIAFERWSTQRNLFDLLSDIAIVITLAHLTQSNNNHLTILLFVTVSTSAILLRRPFTTLVAASATVAILFEQFLSNLTTPASSMTWLRTGTLGVVLFITSVLTEKLTSRLRISEELAQKATDNLIELQKLNHQIIHRMRTGIIVVDEHGNIQLFNSSACELLAIPSLTVTSNLSEQCPALLSKLKDWQKNPTDITAGFQANDDTIEVHASFAVLQRSDRNQTIIFLDDASRMAHQAQQLKLASLGQLTAAIAHEVRNPLGAISHATQLLTESPALTPEDLQMTQIILKHCSRVNDIIENILQLSRRHQAALKRIDLKTWCEEFTKDIIEASSHENHFDLSQMQSIEVQIDISQFRQVLTNLVDNGLRYSAQKTGLRSLHLSSGYLQNSGFPYLDVTDEGHGVPTEKQARLFEPFFTSEPKGTGLGLYIARELCQMNHASLSYIHKPDQGACFRITFAHPNRILAA